MAIFVIGYKESDNGERYIRLYNDKRKQIKDIKESDFRFLIDDLNIVNAEFKEGKLKGTTGSLEKVKNENFIVILGSIVADGEVIGYKYVDSQGIEAYINLENVYQFFNARHVQNASIVQNNNSTFIRGINWEIPIVEDATSKVPYGVEDKPFLSEKTLQEVKKPRKGQVVMFVDHFMYNGELFKKDYALGLSFNSFFIRTTEDMFYKMVRKVKSVYNSIVVDSKNSLIFVKSITNCFDKDVSKLSELSNSLGLKLVLQDISNLKEFFMNTPESRVKNFTYVDLEKLYLDWGADFIIGGNCNTFYDSLECLVSEKYDKTLPQIHDCEFIPSNEFFALFLHWHTQIGNLYQKYLKKCAKHSNIGIVINNPLEYTLYRQGEDPDSPLDIDAFLKEGKLFFFAPSKALKDSNKENIIRIHIFCVDLVASERFNSEERSHSFRFDLEVQVLFTRNNFFEFYDKFRFKNLDSYSASEGLEIKGPLRVKRKNCYNWYDNGSDNSNYLLQYSWALDYKNGLYRVLKDINDIAKTINATVVLDVNEFYSNLRDIDVYYDYKYEKPEVVAEVDKIFCDNFLEYCDTYLKYMYYDALPLIKKELSNFSNIKLILRNSKKYLEEQEKKYPEMIEAKKHIKFENIKKIEFDKEKLAIKVYGK